MNKITVEMDLPHSTLTEVIPGVTILQELGETVHATVTIEPAASRESLPAKHVSVPRTGTSKRAE